MPSWLTMKVFTPVTRYSAGATPVSVAAARRRSLVLELRKLFAQVREHLLRALVLREEGDHLAERGEFFPVVRRRLEPLFGVVVPGREVRGHAGDYVESGAS